MFLKNVLKDSGPTKISLKQFQDFKIYFKGGIKYMKLKYTQYYAKMRKIFK